MNLTAEQLAKYDELMAHGLSRGLGNRGGKMCIEAVWCTVLGLPHGDDPGCVAKSVRYYKINLNDAIWSSELARSKGMYKLGIAQIGSMGVIDDITFSTMITLKTIQIIIPMLFRELFPNNPSCLNAANKCENAIILTEAVGAAGAAAEAAGEAAGAAGAIGAVGATRASAEADKYLILSANLALEILKDLNSPGCRYLKEEN